MKRRIITGIIFVLAALLLMFGIAAVRGARAVENEGPVRLGYLIIRARELSPEQRKFVHDKRTTAKAPERVEIEETHEERTETHSERTETQQQSEERNLRYLGNYKVTGYDICVSCCGSTKGITASGTTATVGRTCAAGRDLPFGTVLYIDGIGYRTVEDRGGGVNGGHIDVLCNDHSECYALTGHYNVYVVEG